MTSSSGSVTSRPAAERLFAVLVAGLTCGLLAVVLSIGVGSLVFTGELRTLLPYSVGIALAGTAVVAAIVALSSSIRGAVAPIQEVPAVALATVATAAFAALQETASDRTILATVIVALSLATVLSGAIAVALGHFRRGFFIRYLPYPVVGGFLAGTGWLIVIGGLGLVIGEPPGLAALDRIDDLPVAANLAFAAGFVALLTAVGMRATGGLSLPAAILLCLVIFNIGVTIGGVGSDEMHDFNWLVDVPRGASLWPPISPADFGSVDWAAVASSLVALPTMVVMTIIALLMNATGIEIETRNDVDLDVELKSSGGASLVAGLFGGAVGFPAVSLTLLARRLGAESRIVGLIVSGISVGALVLGAALLDFIPTFVLGGLLVWLGGGLLVQWIVRAYQQFGIWEYLVILLIFAVIVGVGFAEGLIVGLIAAVILFVVQYGRIDTVHLALTGRDYQSSAAVSEERRRLLAEFGDLISIVRLRGYLFFGSGYTLRRGLAESAPGSPGGVRYLIIDLRRVTGIDSSAVLSFIRLAQIAERYGVAIVLSGLSTAHGEALRRGGLAGGSGGTVRVEDDIDSALIWCEDQLLARHRPGFSHDEERDIDELLGGILSDASAVDQLAPYFDKVVVPPATRLIDEGGPSDAIALIASGSATVEIKSDVGAPIRVATVGPGAIVGEIAYYLNVPASASVTSRNEMIVWRLRREAFVQLRRDLPEAALALHEGIATALARRLLATNRILRFFAD
ncbi:MAG: SLC26A/SulP transporter family protein [Bauldia sp.]|nr:SLC26A/SulP transporter family protein [Bauldia sp.]